MEHVLIASLLGDLGEELLIGEPIDRSYAHIQLGVPPVDHGALPAVNGTVDLDPHALLALTGGDLGEHRLIREFLDRRLAQVIRAGISGNFDNDRLC